MESISIEAWKDFFAFLQVMAIPSGIILTVICLIIFCVGKLDEYNEKIKGDKQPIGEIDDRHKFSNYSFKIIPGDSVYVFSDGYADQFGGPKGKKFKYKQLNELLVQIHTMNVEGQKEKLNSEFENWKGNLEQVDDFGKIMKLLKI